MENHFLNSFVRQSDPNAQLGSDKNHPNMWYNKFGDCIQFKATDVAVVAERVDEYLTIYRSAEDHQPIGFQIKDVKALIQKYFFNGIVVNAAVNDGKLVSVTALLVNVLADFLPSINRREGYAEALRTVPKESDSVAVAA